MRSRYARPAGADRLRRRHRCPPRCRLMRAALLVAAAGAGRAAAPLKAGVVRAIAPDGRRHVAMDAADDRGAADAARRSGDDGGGAADRREVGQGRRAARERRRATPSSAARARRRRPRPTIAAPRSPPACSPCRRGGRGAASDRADARPTRRSGAAEGRLIAALGESAGATSMPCWSRRCAQPTRRWSFDQLLRRPESSLALLAAMKAGTVTPANLGPANVARLRTHPNRQVAQRGRRAARCAQPRRARAKSEIIAALLPESRSRATPRRARRSSPARARAATSSATSARATSGRR